MDSGPGPLVHPGMTSLTNAGQLPEAHYWPQVASDRRLTSA
jgi:hypothetical protein